MYTEEESRAADAVRALRQGFAFEAGKMTHMLNIPVASVAS